MRTEPPVPAEVLAAIREPFLADAAILVDPPVVQPLSLFLDLAGEAMRARLFVVQAEGREEACLRPDLTIPVARQHLATGGGTGRYRYEGKAFRAPPPGERSGHPEEFLQMGVEAYGASDSDPAIVALAWQAASAGGRSDLTLRLGDSALFASFLAAIGVAAPVAARLRRSFGRPAALTSELERKPAVAAGAGRLPALLGGLDEAEAAAVLGELWELAGIEPVGGRPAAEIARRLAARGDLDRAPPLTADQIDLIGRYLAVEGKPGGAMAELGALTSETAFAAAVAALRGTLAALTAAGVREDRMVFAAGFGRSFGYYDGLVFDVVSAALGPDRPVAGGGRYDSLLGRLGAATSERAVGCMVRPARAWSDAP